VESDAGVAAETHLPAARIARLWPRLVAAAADACLLALVGFILGFLLGDRVAPAGTPARLLGLLVAVPYLAFFESKHGGGQAFGKTLLKLVVVDASGQPLSLPRATVRAFLLAAPFLFNGLHSPFLTPWTFLLFWTAGVLIVGVGLANVLILLFNRRSRQGLHDLVARSFVVEKRSLGRPVTARTPRPFAAVAAIWVGLVAAGTVPLLLWATHGPYTSLNTELGKLPHVSNFQVSTLTVTRFGRGHATARNVVGLTLWYRGPDNEAPAIKHAAASAVLWLMPDLGLSSQMQLTLVRGWDLGIASWTTSAMETRSLDEWRAAD
jgi:uncharacterized RDD family membrane protein YckC